MFHRFSFSISLLFAVALCPNLKAQSDNFDSGTLSGAWTKYQFFGQSYTFPTVGNGKGLRIQANPVPGQAPAAAAISQANNYTNFYVAVDVVNWAIKDQAVVVLARWTPGGAAGLAGGAGMIANFDVAQDGEAATDRKGGEFQINVVSPGFLTRTLAVAEISLEPGRAYRIVFQGVDDLYTAQMYALNDLSKPLATIQAHDSTYTSGLSGFLSFSRNGTTGTTDVTIDNYYAAATDPNLAIAPVIAHPIPGTPVIDSRVPAARWKNFHNPSSGIAFTARTYTADVINSSATKLLLNGVDLSSQLLLSANGTSVTGNLPGAALSPNTVYNAQVEVSDTTGLKKYTNTFWFDTFSDAFLLSSPVKTIEAEDYNHDSGQFEAEPIPVSGADTNGSVFTGFGCYGTVGAPDVDYSKPAGFFNFVLAEYRNSDRVQITQGSYLPGSRDEAADLLDSVTYIAPYRINDTQRSQYVATNIWEYQVRLTSPGDWMNYTRIFAPTNYLVFLRCGTFGSTTIYLDKVTSDPTTNAQTTVRLGTFNVDNHEMRLNYSYIPLMSGSFPAVLSLADTNTLRLTMGGTTVKDERLVSLDYLLFVPTSSGATVFDNFEDGNDTANPQWDRNDPIGGVTAPPASYTFPSGHYRIQAPAPLDCVAGPARAGAFIAGVEYSDFYVSADLIDFDDTTRQAFGIAARINTPGLGTTGGYLFSWEPGSGPLPGTGGDLDISKIINESPAGQIETAPSALHLTRGKSYRFVFMGSGNNFEGQVYELPDTINPLIRLPATDPGNLYPSGRVGLIVASQSSCSVNADATFDNFLATTAEPRLAVSVSGKSVNLTWPLIPFRLQSASSLSPAVWTDVTTGIGTYADHYGYTVASPAGAQFFRLVYP